MRKALYAAFAAAAILILATPANRAVAMPIASPSTIGVAAAQSGTLTPAHYWVRHHYSVWRGPYVYPRHYWYANPAPYAHYYVGPWGSWYNGGPYWGWGGYINSWYM